jgi:phosphatidylglycerol:prolipoprotein diacylglycerol transferase
MHPKLFDIGPLTVYTYGFLLAIGFISGVWLAARYARREGIDEEKIWNLGLIVIASGLIGAKILMVLTDYEYYVHHPREIFSLSTLQSGGVFFGGLLTSLLAAAWYFRRQKLPGWQTADLFAPGIALGHAIGRLGCFFAGCCYGKPTTVPWAVTFTNKLAQDLVGVPVGVPLHPTQLYEAGAEFLIFLALLAFRKRKTYHGQIVLLYLVLYSCARFIIEFYRGDQERGVFLGGWLSTSQLIGLIVIPAAIIGMRIRSKRKLGEKVGVS